MKFSYRTMAAAAVLTAAAATGCDSKHETKVADQPTHDAPAGVSGQTPDTPAKKSDTAMQDVGAGMKAMGQDAKSGNMSAMGQDAKATAKGAGGLVGALKDKMGGASTQPANP